MNNCAAFKYKQADLHLNSVYRKVVKSMTRDLADAEKTGDQEQIKYEESGIASLKEAERAWRSYRDIQCDAVSERYQGGSMRPMLYAECLTKLTEHRIADLKNVYGDELE